MAQSSEWLPWVKANAPTLDARLQLKLARAIEATIVLKVALPALEPGDAVNVAMELVKDSDAHRVIEHNTEALYALKEKDSDA